MPENKQNVIPELHYFQDLALKKDDISFSIQLFNFESQKLNSFRKYSKPQFAEYMNVQML